MKSSQKGKGVRIIGGNNLPRRLDPLWWRCRFRLIVVFLVRYQWLNVANCDSLLWAQSWRLENVQEIVVEWQWFCTIYLTSLHFNLIHSVKNMSVTWNWISTILSTNRNRIAPLIKTIYVPLHQDKTWIDRLTKTIKTNKIV